jgi:uncharacterized protein (DUF1330 family)
MKIHLILAAFLGVMVGCAVMYTLKAQPAAPAYFVAEAVVTNPEADRAVIAKLPATAQAFGGKYLARGGNIVTFEGEPPKRVVIVAFDNMQQVVAWRSDPQVKLLEQERKKIGTALRLYAVEGLPQ